MSESRNARGSRAEEPGNTAITVPSGATPKPSGSGNACGRSGTASVRMPISIAKDPRTPATKERLSTAVSSLPNGLRSQLPGGKIGAEEVVPGNP